MFGGNNQPGTTPSIGGQGFGMTQQSGTSSFGTSPFGGSTVATPSIFGGSTTLTSGRVQTGGFSSLSQGNSGFASGNQASGGFGSGNQGSGGFGSGNQASGGFGSGNIQIGGFSSGNQGNSGFGTSGFGLGNQGSSGFGSGSQGVGGFGTVTQGSGGGFGTGDQGTGSSFGGINQGNSGFGTGGSIGFGNATHGTTGAVGFGSVNQGISGSGGFSGNVQSPNLFGGTAQQPVISSTSIFGGTTQQTPSQATSLFGTTVKQTSAPTNLFGGLAQQTISQATNLFGTSGQAITTTTSSFGGTVQQSTGTDFQKSTQSEQGLFGKPPVTSQQPFSLYESWNNKKSVSGNLYARPLKEYLPSSSVFDGSTQSISTGSTQSTLFSGQSSDNTEKTTTLFGKQQTQAEAVPLFGKPPQMSSEDTSDKSKNLWTNQGAEEPKDQQNIKRTIHRPATGGLFGKAVTEVTDDRQTQRKLVRRTTEGEAQQGQGESQNRKNLITRRTSVQDDLATKVAIVCKGLPAKFNNVFDMRTHFGRYGKVKRVFPNTRKQMVTVHFEDHESAKNAKARGRYLADVQEPMQIFWSTYGPKPGMSPAQKSPLFREKKKEPVSEVDDELRSMSGTSDMTFGESRPFSKPKPRDFSSTARSRSPVPRNRSPSPKPRSQSPAPINTSDLKMTLRTLGDSMGRNSQEKYEIMLKSDKLVRDALGLHMKKQTELADAKTLTAACEDMCPEKERYQREYQRRLSVYELVPGTDQVDHACAVKEYSRSSADQDLPLPNELRPPKVLDKTMNYLLNNIADDGGDGKWGDWFDFLWNRTRSIRKEITQLQICDLTAVSLVEKCTRFHIYCSERLCEEDMMVFDEKINNENLTKCLQTLKEMYHDLQTKKSIVCPNEAEFRSYIVLMNLNEGDVLREVQQLRTEVRESSELRFVLNVHSALSSHNYIRFFKLLGQAEFLPACIMHRYFNQVRAKALHIMTKAYKNNPLPVSEVERLLLFESESEASSFCSHHGLIIQDDQVIMDKHAIITPEASFLPTRAVNIIESKQHTSVGEALNGGPLPPNTISQPVSSFSSDGRFLTSSLPIPSSALDRSSQPGPSNSPVKAQPTAKPILIEEEKPPVAKLVYTNEEVKDIAKELFLEVIKEISTNMATTFVKAINVYLQKAEPTLDDMIEETVVEQVRSVAEEFLVDFEKEKTEKIARERAERSLSRERASHQVTHELIDLVLNEEVKDVAMEENNVVQEELKKQSTQRAIVHLTTEILYEVMDEECEDEGAATYQTDVVDRLEELQQISTAVQLLMKARFFNRWKNRLAGHQRLQKSMATFPPAPSMNSMEDQLTTMLPDSQGIQGNSIHIGNNARLTLLSPGHVIDGQARIQKSLVLQTYWSKIRREKAWTPLDITQIVGQQLVRLQRAKCKQTNTWSGKVTRLHWKLLVCLPDPQGDDSIQLWCDWITAKLSRGTVPNTTHPQLTSLLSLYHRDIGPHHELGLCIRAIKGVPSRQQRQYLHSQYCIQATSALMFMVNTCKHTDIEEYWMLESSRLRLIVEKNAEFNIQPPLVVIVPFSKFTAKEVRRGLQLESLEDDDLIDICDIVVMSSGVEHPASMKKLIKAVQDLAHRWQDVSVPSKLNLHEFVEEIIYREFYTVVYQDLASRGKKGELHQAPSNLLALYNSLIDHLSEVVSDEQLTHVAWPLPELAGTSPELPGLGWNSQDHLSNLRDTVLELSLPEWECDTESENWTQAVDDVLAYVGVVAEDGGNNAMLYSKINNLLYKTRQSFEERCFITLGEDDCNPLYVNMPWTDIIVACVNHRVSNLQPQLMDNEEGMDVYYFDSQLKEFIPPPEWFVTVRNDQQQELPVLRDSFVRSAKRKHDESSSFHSSPKYRIPDSPSINLEPENPNQIASKELGHELDQVIANERKANSDFEAYLKSTLAAGEIIDNNISENVDLSFTPLELEVPLFRRLSAPVTSFYSPGISRSRTSSSKKSGPKFYSPGLSKSAEKYNPGHNEYDLLSTSIPVTDKLELLNNSLNSQRQANKLFEMKLQAFIDMDNF